MIKEDLLLIANEKQALRHYFQKTLKELSLQRRQQAKEELSKTLLHRLHNYSCIASFASKEDEVCLKDINSHLLKEKRLSLFMISQDLLEPYLIDPLQPEYKKNRFGIFEPIPEKAIKLDFFSIDCILVPALAYDQENARLGRGKGHYDRYLSFLKEKGHFPQLIGVGFKEQLHLTSLPKESHDQTLHEVLLA